MLCGGVTACHRYGVCVCVLCGVLSVVWCVCTVWCGVCVLCGVLSVVWCVCTVRCAECGVVCVYCVVCVHCAVC